MGRITHEYDENDGVSWKVIPEWTKTGLVVAHIQHLHRTKTIETLEHTPKQEIFMELEKLIGNGRGIPETARMAFLWYLGLFRSQKTNNSLHFPVRNGLSFPTILYWALGESAEKYITWLGLSENTRPEEMFSGKMLYQFNSHPDRDILRWHIHNILEGGKTEKQYSIESCILFLLESYRYRKNVEYISLLESIISIPDTNINALFTYDNEYYSLFDLVFFHYRDSSGIHEQVLNSLIERWAKRTSALLEPKNQKRVPGYSYTAADRYELNSSNTYQ